METEPAPSDDSTPPEGTADEPVPAVPTKETTPVWAQTNPAAPAHKKGDPDWSKTEPSTNGGGGRPAPPWAATVPSSRGVPAEIHETAGGDEPAKRSDSSEPPLVAPLTDPPKAVAADAMKSTWPPAAESSPAPPEETDIWPPEPPTERAMPAWPPLSEVGGGDEAGPATPAQPIPGWLDSFEPTAASSSPLAGSDPAPATVSSTVPPTPAPPAITPPSAPASALTTPPATVPPATAPPVSVPPATVPPASVPPAADDVPVAASTPPPTVPVVPVPGPATAPPPAAPPTVDPVSETAPARPSQAAEPSRPVWAPGPAAAEPARPVAKAASTPPMQIPAWAPRVPLASEPGTPTWFSPKEEIPHATAQPIPPTAPTPEPAPTSPVAGGQLPVAQIPIAPKAPAQPQPAKVSTWEVVEQPRKSAPHGAVQKGPTAEDRSYAEWFAWAKRGGAPASACHAAAQGAFKALSGGKDVTTAVQWATAAMSQPPEAVSYARQQYCAWFALANIDLNLDQHRAHLFSAAAIQALDAGQDASAAHAAGLAAAGIK